MGVTGASQAVAGAHGKALASMPFGDWHDFTNAQRADVTVTLTKAVLPLFIADSPAAAAAAGARVEGEAAALDALFGVLQPGDPSFPIVTP